MVTERECFPASALRESLPDSVHVLERSCLEPTDIGSLDVFLAVVELAIGKPISNGPLDGASNLPDAPSNVFPLVVGQAIRHDHANGGKTDVLRYQNHFLVFHFPLPLFTEVTPG